MRPLLLTGLLVLCTAFSAISQTRVVGYLPTYRFTFPVDYSKLTHLNLSFAKTDGAGNLSFSSNITPIVNAAHDKGVKVLASIGGAGVTATEAGYYSNLQQSGNVKDFVSKIKSFLIANNLDGLDVDLEGNNIGANYELFITTLADTLKPAGLSLTAALAIWNGDKVSATAAQSFDFINMMAYDATGPWNPNNEGQHSSYDFALEHINYWLLTKGIAKSKLVLGLPFYGYEFDNGGPVESWTYASILSNFSGQSPSTKDQIGSLYYNGAETIEEKTELALFKVSGVMIWELGQDAIGDASLLKVINDVTGPVGVDEKEFSKFAVSVFPNPISDEVSVSWSTNGRREWSVEIRNALGIQLGSDWDIQLSNEHGRAELNMSEFPEGVYHVILRSESESLSTQVLKK